MLDEKEGIDNMAVRRLRHATSFTNSEMGEADVEGVLDVGGKDRRFSDAGQRRPLEDGTIDLNAMETNGFIEKMSGSNAFKTVLPSHPVLDTIMILLIILQLPSLLLTILQAVFAMKTFGRLPTPTPGSPLTLTTILLQGKDGGPSILTVVVTDIAVALFSMFLWPSARQYLIEFAQAVMAITIGAGDCSQSGVLKNAAVCFGVLYGKDAFNRHYESDSWTVPLRPGHVGDAISEKHWHRVLRSCLAIHIVAQGGMKVFRAWLMNNPRFKNNPSEKKADGVVGQKGKEKDKDKEREKEFKDRDLEQVGASATTASPTPQAMDVKSRKKKQQNIVWSTQPLWAAIGNLLVHIAKFREEQQTQAESSPDSLYTAYTRYLAEGFKGSIWITNITSDTVTFEATQYGLSRSDVDSSVEGASTALVRGYRPETSPFYVRVNGVIWPQSKFTKSTETFDEDGYSNWSQVDWTMEISGLTASTEYDFEFVWTEDGSTIYATSACTRQADGKENVCNVPLPLHANKDIDSQIIPSVTGKPQRPLSPVTTLLNSLNQANTSLTEQRARVRKMKKENARRLNALRSEIESLRSRLGTGDKGEERARRRVLFLRESVRRAEDDVARMTAELEQLCNLPEDEAEQYNAKRREWLEEKKRLRDEERSAENSKRDASKRVEAIESELASLAVKREKLRTRRTKLAKDLERIQGQKSAELERQQALANRRDRDRARQQQEEELIRAINETEFKVTNIRQRIAENWAIVSAAEAAGSSFPPGPLNPSIYSPMASTASLSGPPGLNLPVNVYPHSTLAPTTNPPAITAPLPASAQFATPFIPGAHMTLQRQRSGSFLSAHETLPSMTKVEEGMGMGKVRITPPPGEGKVGVEGSRQ